LPTAIAIVRAKSDFDTMSQDTVIRLSHCHLAAIGANLNTSHHCPDRLDRTGAASIFLQVKIGCSHHVSVLVVIHQGTIPGCACETYGRPSSP
jgi:hypothetical protein